MFIVNNSLVWFLAFLSIGDSRDCGVIIIMGPNPWDSYENCTSASRVIVHSTLNYHLRLALLEKINPNLKDFNKEDYMHTILIESNINLTWNHETLPKLKEVVTLEEIRYKAHTVQIKQNFPFHYTKQMEEKFTKSGVAKDEIDVGQDNSCVVWTNEKAYGNENCTTMMGHVVINEYFKTDSRMAKRLRSVHTHYGNILINGSTLRNLSLFNALNKVDCLQPNICRPHAIEIINNPHLTGSFYNLSTVITKKEKFRVANNSKLESYHVDSLGGVFSSYDSKNYNIDRGPCKFTERLVSNKTFYDMKGCSVIEGDLLINGSTNLTDDVLKLQLYEIREIHGCLTIENIKVNQLDFLISLEVVNCTKKRNAVIIKNNEILRRVSLQLTKVYARTGYNHVFMKNNTLLCKVYTKFFTDYLEIVDGPPRIVINPHLEFCQNNTKESSGWHFLAAALGAILPAIFWGTVTVFRSRKTRRRR